MILRRPSIALAALALVTVQVVATPAKAESWSFFPWMSSAPSEKPRVTSRIEQAPVQQVVPRTAVVRQTQTRVVQPRLVQTRVLEPTRSIFSQPYMVVGLGG
jgi:hypothetical protein